MASKMTADYVTHSGFGDMSALTKSSLGVMSALLLAVVLGRLLSVHVDPQEPPALKPSIPFIGHLIGMLRFRSNFLSVVFKDRMPIASLPILNGKMYAVWDANLIQAIYRNKNFSFEPFIIEFARREIGYDDAADKIVRETDLVPDFIRTSHDGMNTHHLHQMNVNALRYVGDRLFAIRSDEDLVVPNLYLFTRDLMTMATCEVLYGKENPAKKSPTFLDDVWTFESNLSILMANVLPSITARKPFQARARLQSALGQYYASFADQNEDTAGITRQRAETLRKYGINGAQIGVFELALLHVSTSNTIPTLFWFVAYVFTQPELVAQLQEEAMNAIEHGPEDKVTVNLDVLSEKCPLLVSSYKETIRLANAAVGNRKVMADTTISDGKGKTYLLKEGTALQMPSDVLHHSEAAWGSDVEQFRADRFMDQGDDATKDSIKVKRLSYVPFGGGKHLCPGRNFAFAENMGFVLSLVLGFTVSPIDGDWASFKVPQQQQCSLVAAVRKPVLGGENFGARIARRKGWESTQWNYVSGGRR